VARKAPYLCFRAFWLRPSMGVNSSVQPWRSTRKSFASSGVAFPQTACQVQKRLPWTRSVRILGFRV